MPQEMTPDWLRSHVEWRFPEMDLGSVDFGSVAAELDRVSTLLQRLDERQLPHDLFEIG